MPTLNQLTKPITVNPTSRRKNIGRFDYFYYNRTGHINTNHMVGPVMTALRETLPKVVNQKPIDDANTKIYPVPGFDRTMDVLIVVKPITDVKTQIVLYIKKDLKWDQKVIDLIGDLNKVCTKIGGTAHFGNADGSKTETQSAT